MKNYENMWEELKEDIELLKFHIKCQKKWNNNDNKENIKKEYIIMLKTINIIQSYVENIESEE